MEKGDRVEVIETGQVARVDEIMPPPDGEGEALVYVTWVPDEEIGDHERIGLYRKASQLRALDRDYPA